MRLGKWPIIAGGALALLAGAFWALGGAAPLRPWAPDRHLQNFRAGQAARAGFELVAMASLPAAVREGRSGGGLRVERYPLDPDPDSFDVEQPGLAYFTHVTVAWPDASGAAGPFVFDFYLHGPGSEPSEAVVRVSGLDIRKFLHASTAGLSDAPDLARMQAYFAEFSRKEKVIYPAEGAAPRREISPAERAKLARLATTLQPLAARATALPAPLQALLAKLESELASASPRLAAIDYNLRQLETQLARSRVATEDWQPTLAAARDEMTQLAALGKVGRLALVNNCREPGNYELSVDDALGRSLLHASFAFAPDTYDAILAGYQGFGIREQGTGIRIPNGIWRSDARYALHALLPWNYLKFLPRVGIDTFALAGPPSQEGALDVSEGAIPYPDAEFEVRVKSGAELGQEPLSYVRVDAGLDMPLGFEAPDHSRASAYWNDPAHQGKLVPHYYRRFEDLQRYAVHLSGFETNGVYVGRSDLEVYDEEREEGRWPFDFSHLAQLQDYEVREGPEGRFELRLKSRAASDRAVHFVLGNLRLAPGEHVSFLLGMGAQPLASGYDDDLFRSTPPYAFAYASDGTVLDHHDTAIGVERVVLERTRDGRLRVQLISHERILPVWEGFVPAAS